jgi:hypothetical protein
MMVNKRQRDVRKVPEQKKKKNKKTKHNGRWAAAGGGDGFPTYVQAVKQTKKYHMFLIKNGRDHGSARGTLEPSAAGTELHGATSMRRDKKKKKKKKKKTNKN